FLPQVCGELVHGSAPALLHAVASFVEGLALDLGRGIRGNPLHSDLGLAALLLEADGRENLELPVGVAWVPGYAAFRIGKRDDGDQLFRRLDLAIGELAPHVAAIGRFHSVVEDAAGTQVDLAGMHLEALRPPPLLQALGLGPGLPQLVARRIEHARDLEEFHRSTRTLNPP